MSIEFFAKHVTVQTIYKSWDEDWSSNFWDVPLNKFANFKITITSTDGRLDEVEVRSTAEPGVFLVIKPGHIDQAPAWLQRLTNVHLELV